MEKLSYFLPRGRDLSEQELVSVVSELGRRPDLWSHLVSHDPSRRVYEQLWGDDHVTAWLICWMENHDTGFHDHDVSSGAVAVVDGTLVEHNLAVGTDTIETLVDGGSVFSFGPDHIHRLTCAIGGSVSVHAYSPPLWRMGQYSVGADGRLHRHSVSYADELRPIDPPTGIA